MIIHTEIHGVPCRVHVTWYQPADPGCVTGPVDLCYPPQGAEVEFEVLGANLMRDRVLEASMDDADVRAVEQEIIAAMRARDVQARIEREEGVGLDQYMNDLAADGRFARI